ncbi:MAG: BatD family protein [Bacteroidales bacterium]|jgi:hypothetical protein|nr:BatD family protein [Bacteroidales bacterium]
MKYFLSVFFFFLSVWIQAQVNVTVECPRVVRVGEPFQLDVKVNAQSSAPEFPEMPTFKIVRNMGMQQGYRSYFSGNKTVSSVTVTYSYAIQASREGTHEIPPVEVTVDRKKYQSAPVQVQVIAGTSPGQPAQQGQAPPQQESATAKPDNPQVKTDHRDIFVSVIPSRTKIYQGEHITATLKLFSKVNISSINHLKPPNFEGFYKQELETPPLRSLEPENVNGEMYRTGVLQQVILFPQKSGTLTISPCSMEVGVPQRVQTRSYSLFDDLLGGMVQTIPREVKSHAVAVTVMPLPEGKPASFTNGVGQLKMDVSVNKTEMKANDPVTLKVVISGSGNIKFVDAPRINFPPDFDPFDPKINTSLNATATAGSKTFEYLIIPRHGGTYKLPSIEFSYFDPQARQYKTVHSEEYILTVEKGDEQPGTTVISGVTREDVKFLGKDIRYIKPSDMALYRSGDHFFGTWGFCLWYILPLLTFSFIVYFRRKYIRKYADAALVKNRRASRYAARRLKQARACMNSGQQAKMYEELSRALWGYLSDKLNIPIAELSKENGKLAMQQHQVDDASADEFIGVIDDCEFARYAPSKEVADMKTLYDRAVDVINKMQKAMNNSQFPISNT